MLIFSHIIQCYLLHFTRLNIFDMPLAPICYQDTINSSFSTQTLEIFSCLQVMSLSAICITVSWFHIGLSDRSHDKVDSAGWLRAAIPAPLLSCSTELPPASPTEITLVEKTDVLQLLLLMLIRLINLTFQVLDIVPDKYKYYFIRRILIR